MCLTPPASAELARVLSRAEYPEVYGFLGRALKRSHYQWYSLIFSRSLRYPCISIAHIQSYFYSHLSSSLWLSFLVFDALHPGRLGAASM